MKMMHWMTRGLMSVKILKWVKNGETFIRVRVDRQLYRNKRWRCWEVDDYIQNSWIKCSFFFFLKKTFFTCLPIQKNPQAFIWPVTFLTCVLIYNVVKWQPSYLKRGKRQATTKHMSNDNWVKLPLAVYLHSESSVKLADITVLVLNADSTEF